MCRGSQKYEKEDNLNISTQMSLKLLTPNVEVLRLLIVCLQVTGTWSALHFVHLGKGTPKVDFFNFCYCTGFHRCPHVSPLTISVPEASLEEHCGCLSATLVVR